MAKVGDRFNPYRMFDGVFIPECVCQYKGISPGAKLAYGRFCRFAGKTGEVFPSIATLGKEIGCSPTQARSYTKELVDERFVEIEQDPGRSNTYYFLWHKAFDGEVGSVRFAPPLQDPDGVATPPGSCAPPLQDPDGVPLQDAGAERESGEMTQQGESFIARSQSPTTDFDSDAVSLVQSLYSRLNRGAKLINLRTRQSEMICGSIRRADAEWGRAEFQSAIEAYLSDRSDWLREHKWPLPAFLKQISKYVPASQNTAPISQYNRTVTAVPDSPQTLPFAAQEWNRVVTAGPQVEEWTRRDRGLDAAAIDQDFLDSLPKILPLCQKAFEIQPEEIGWLNFRWLLGKHRTTGEDNWYRLKHQGNWLTQKRGLKAAKADPFAELRKELGIA